MHITKDDLSLITLALDPEAQLSEGQRIRLTQLRFIMETFGTHVGQSHTVKITYN